MKKFSLYFVLAMMILIHTIDMELTTHYIGNNWQKETFPLMRYCICHFGIHASCWISRIFMYFCFYVFLCNSDSKNLQRLLVLTTTIYWTSMVSWLFSLGILAWWPHA